MIRKGGFQKRRSAKTGVFRNAYLPLWRAVMVFGHQACALGQKSSKHSLVTKTYLLISSVEGRIRCENASVDADYYVLPSVIVLLTFWLKRFCCHLFDTIILWHSSSAGRGSIETSPMSFSCLSCYVSFCNRDIVPIQLFKSANKQKMQGCERGLAVKW